MDFEQAAETVIRRVRELMPDITDDAIDYIFQNFQFYSDSDMIRLAFTTEGSIRNYINVLGLGNLPHQLFGDDNDEPLFITSSMVVTHEDVTFPPTTLGYFESLIRNLLVRFYEGRAATLEALRNTFLREDNTYIPAEGYSISGEIGYSFINLLALMKRLRLIEWPYGKLSLIMAEDDMKFRSIRKTIFIKFHPGSQLTREAVSDYFSRFGPIENVTIPRREPPYFGFVTFFSEDTVKVLLSGGPSHGICGYEVFIEAYKQHAERTYTGSEAGAELGQGLSTSSRPYFNHGI